MSDLMSKANGSSAPSWAPETPFLERFLSNETVGTLAPAPGRGPLEGPFHAVYREAPNSDEVDATSALIAELLEELHDEEFDEALFELVDEAWELSGPRLSHEARQAALWDTRTERMLSEHFQPLVRRAEEMADALSEHFSTTSGDLSEAEIDQSFERLAADAFDTEGLSPPFQHFLKSWGKKLKGIAKGALKVATTVARKGVQLASGPLVKLALATLRKTIGPFVKKIINVVLDKLPPAYRPLAAKLAAQFGGAAAKAVKTAAAAAAPATNGGAPPQSAAPSASTDAAITAAPPADSAATDTTDGQQADAAPSLANVQSELDLQVLETLLHPDESQESASLYEGEAVDTWGELDQARADFVREIGDLPPGRSPAVAVDNFIPALLMALPPAIKIVGRGNVLKLLGGMITPLLQPVVGKAVAPQLGRAIADIGLKALLKSELDADQMHELGAQTVATVVEETVRDVAGLPEEVFNDEALLESHVRTAYEAAVARNFPPAMVKPALRESAGVNGTWVALPETGTKYYKKFTRIFDVTITPQLASAVRTFGGRTLASFLRDTLRLEGPRRARVHLYEAIPRTRLSRISKLEKVRGLGSTQRWAWTQLHPLTPEIAAALLQQPGLGRALPARVDPRQSLLGQRFYVLEIDGAPARPQGVGTSLGITLDFVRNEIRLRLYLSEVTAQEIAGAVRKNVGAGVLGARLRSAFAEFSGAFGAGGGHELVRLVLESRPGGASRDLTTAVRQALERRVGGRVVEWGWAALVQHVQRAAAEFADITSQPPDGVTCVIKFPNPDGFQSLRRAFQGAAGQTLTDWPPKHVPASQVRLIAGDVRG